MYSMQEMPTELVEEIFLRLGDWRDLTCPACTCQASCRLLLRPVTWRKLLDRTRVVHQGVGFNEERATIQVGHIMTFLNTHGVGHEDLLEILHETICHEQQNWKRLWWDGHQAFEAHEDPNIVIVSSPGHDETMGRHPITGQGLKLLALTEREGARHTIHQINLMDNPTNSSLLLSLELIASEQEEQILEMFSSGQISCYDREDGQALGSLLEKCDSWRAETLNMWGELEPQAWGRLGRAAPRGLVGDFCTWKEVRLAAVEGDLLAIKMITQRFWVVEDHPLLGLIVSSDN